MDDQQIEWMREDVEKLERKVIDLEYALDRLKEDFDKLEYKLINADILKGN